MTAAYMLVGDLAARGCCALAPKPALCGPGWALTYADLADRVDRLAASFAADGIVRGDRIALLAPNVPEVLETVFAASQLGATIVPLNLRLLPSEMRFQAEDADARFAVVHAALTAEAAAAGLLDRPSWTIGGDLEERRAKAVASELRRGRPGDVLVQLYTSGTTGSPKGCMLRQRNWLSATLSFGSRLGLSEADVVMTPLPFFHVAGLGFVLSALMAGATVCLPGSTDNEEAWQVAREHHVTVLQTLSSYAHLLRSPLARPEQLRGIFGPSRYDRVLDDLPEGVQVWSGYGSTELCGYATVTEGRWLKDRDGVMGRPLPGYLIRVVDEHDEPVPPGTVGELVARGPSVTNGYWNLPEASAEALRGGWFHSGDLVRFDPEGVFCFVDRLKDMVKTGGENVYCVEVEATLLRHPRVREAAVIGVPDPRWGEAVKAVVIPDGEVSAPELDAWCLERMAAYKRPRWYSFVGTLPRNAMAKVVKPRLRRDHDPETAIRLPERVP